MLGGFTFIVAVFVSTALIPPLTQASKYLGLIDFPDKRKIHADAIPRVGGIGIIAGVVTPVLMWVPLREDIRAYLISVLILAIFGIWDDRTNLNYRLKFLGQFLAVLVVVVYGDVVIDRFPFVEEGVIPPAIAIPFTVILLVGITNAINLSDGLDGLAGGTTLLAVGCIAILANTAGDDVIVWTCLAVIGATLGFLRFNTFPARVFMGDAGSQFLGFTVGFLAVVVTNTSNRALSPVLPLLILGLPILDTVWVMAQRLAKGRSPFSPDRSHIHHKLLGIGFSHYEAVLAIYTVQALLVSLALILSYARDGLIILLYLFFCAAVFTLLKIISLGNWRKKTAEESPGWLGRTITYLREIGLLSKGPYLFLEGALPAFLVFGAIYPDHIPVDIVASSILLFVILLAAFVFRPIHFNLIERLATYVTAAFIAYLIETSVSTSDTYKIYIHSFFGLLAIVIAVWVRFAGQRIFRVSGLDFLILLIAVAIPNIPGSLLPNTVIGVVAIESIILFYGAEVLLAQKSRRWDLLRFTTLGSLAILGVRGLI